VLVWLNTQQNLRLEVRTECSDMANQKKNSGSKSGSWKKERASVNRQGGSKSQSNKYRPEADSSERPEAGSGERYWRAGYTRKDGTKVKGHYVKNPNQK
jgi:hypothetical protein